MDPENDSLNLDDNPAQSIIDAAPEPSEHAIAAAQSNVQADPQPAADTGERFDPAKHAMGADGKGVKTAKGTWRKKRGTGSRVTLPDKTAETQAATRAVDEAKARAAGGAAAGSIFLLGTALGGDEWAPRKDPIDEHAMMNQAWGDYFVSKGVVDFPPGVALFMALAMYAAPRFTMPKTRERAKGVKAWIALRVAKRRVKKELRKRGIVAEVEIVEGVLHIDGKPHHGARVNSRNERERKDDAREA